MEHIHVWLGCFTQCKSAYHLSGCMLLLVYRDLLVCEGFLYCGILAMKFPLIVIIFTNCLRCISSFRKPFCSFCLFISFLPCCKSWRTLGSFRKLYKPLKSSQSCFKMNKNMTVYKPGLMQTTSLLESPLENFIFNCLEISS